MSQHEILLEFMNKPSFYRFKIEKDSTHFEVASRERVVPDCFSHSYWEALLGFCGRFHESLRKTSVFSVNEGTCCVCSVLLWLQSDKIKPCIPKVIEGDSQSTAGLKLAKEENIWPYMRVCLGLKHNSSIF